MVGNVEHVAQACGGLERLFRRAYAMYAPADHTGCETKEDIESRDNAWLARVQDTLGTYIFGRDALKDGAPPVDCFIPKHVEKLVAELLVEETRQASDYYRQPVVIRTATA